MHIRLKDYKTTTFKGGEDQRFCYRIVIDGTPYFLRVFPPEYDFHDPRNTVKTLSLLKGKFPAEQLADLQPEIGLIHVEDDCVGYLTKSVEGQVPALSESNLKVMGALLGKLHSLPVKIDHRAARTLHAELHLSLKSLQESKAKASSNLKSLIDDIEQQLRESLQQPKYEQVLIHNDAHPGNMLLSNQLHLIDWDGTGLGSRSEELGFLIYSCMPRSGVAQPQNWLELILQGYHKHSTIPADELQHFDHALRYRPLTYLVDRIQRDPQGGFLNDPEFQDWLQRYESIDSVFRRIQLVR